MHKITMPEIHEFYKSMKPNELLLDIREPEEFQEGHVPGARNIPMGEVTEHADELAKFDKVYIYCRSGGRAQNVWLELAQKGLKNTLVVANGGMLDWNALGFEVETG